MAEKRQHQRIDCIEKCLLCHADSRYCGEVLNTSSSGALVKLYRFIPGKIMPGDTCSFILSNHPSTSFCKRKGRIAHINNERIGLEILDQEF